MIRLHVITFCYIVMHFAGIEAEKRLVLQGETDILTKLQNMEAEISELQIITAEVQQLQQKVAQLENECQRNASFAPAFMTFISSSTFDCLANQHVVFDDVRLNAGTYYNPTHGVFRAPVSGTYHFAMTLSIDPDNAHDLHVYIVTGDGTKVLGYIFCDNTHTGWQERTVSVVAHLGAGEDVWIKCVTPSRIAGGLHSHFSGFLVNV